MGEKVKIKFSGVGEYGDTEINWPEGWPVPPVDAEITLSDGNTAFVRTVVWYPHGDLYGSANLEPFVYVVYGPRRVNYG